MNEILIEQLCKRYDDHTILRDLNFSIPYGSSVCIIGPSGCGKTTLLRLLMGLEQPTSGTIRNLSKHISPVFQEDRLCEVMTALANVRIAADCSIAQCRDLLMELGLKDAIDTPAEQLSGGMKRRVSIARALVHRSELLLMDEPFSGLDAETAAVTASVIRRYTNSRTLIYTAHENYQVLPGDRVIDLRDTGV